MQVQKSKNSSQFIPKSSTALLYAFIICLQTGRNLNGEVRLLINKEVPHLSPDQCVEHFTKQFNVLKLYEKSTMVLKADISPVSKKKSNLCTTFFLSW